MNLTLEYYKEKWDFRLLDTGGGFRLEDWGGVRLVRPDPQAIWERKLSEQEWENFHAKFVNKDWERKQFVVPSWFLAWQELQFKLKLTPFKHTGIFAEQAAHWSWLQDQVKSLKSKVKSKSKAAKALQATDYKLHPRVLNLFGYTGAATCVLARAGAHVTHVDASKPSMTWANDNYKLNKLPMDSVRWIVDDALTFVKREGRRGNKYQGIVLDPPAFGHGPTGKTWIFEKDIPDLLVACTDLLDTSSTSFVLINAYATNTSAISLHNLAEDVFTGAKLSSGELCLKQESADRLVSTGVFSKVLYKI